MASIRFKNQFALEIESQFSKVLKSLTRVSESELIKSLELLFFSEIARRRNPWFMEVFWSFKRPLNWREISIKTMIYFIFLVALPFEEFSQYCLTKINWEALFAKRNFLKEKSRNLYELILCTFLLDCRILNSIGFWLWWINWGNQGKLQQEWKNRKLNLFFSETFKVF